MFSRSSQGKHMVYRNATSSLEVLCLRCESGSKVKCVVVFLFARGGELVCISRLMLFWPLLPLYSSSCILGRHRKLRRMSGRKRSMNKPTRWQLLLSKKEVVDVIDLIDECDQ
ncbi:hypothetical protein VPH35_075869 [Triticum aestivum]